MFQGFETIQKQAKDGADVAAKSAGIVAKGFQTITTEQVDFAKKAFELGTANFEKITGAKSIEKAFEIQNDYFKSAYEGFVAHVNKLGELYVSVAKDAYKPFEVVTAKAGK